MSNIPLDNKSTKTRKNWEVLEGDHRMMEFREAAILAVNCKSPWPAHMRQATLVLAMTGVMVPYEIKSKKDQNIKQITSSPLNQCIYIHVQFWNFCVTFQFMVTWFMRMWLSRLELPALHIFTLLDQWLRKISTKYSKL